MTLLDTLMGRQREREQTAIVSYTKLVDDIADGANLKPEFVERLLTDFRKSPETLAADVAAILERRKLQSLADSLPDLEQQLRGLNDTRLVALKKYEADRHELIERMDHAHNAVHGEFKGADRALRDQISAASLARKILTRQADTGEAAPPMQVGPGVQHANEGLAVGPGPLRFV